MHWSYIFLALTHQIVIIDEMKNDDLDVYKWKVVLM